MVECVAQPQTTESPLDLSRCTINPLAKIFIDSILLYSEGGGAHMASKAEVIWKSWFHCICGETKDLILSLLVNFARGPILTPERGLRN